MSPPRTPLSNDTRLFPIKPIHLAGGTILRVRRSFELCGDVHFITTDKVVRFSDFSQLNLLSYVPNAMASRGFFMSFPYEWKLAASRRFPTENPFRKIFGTVHSFDCLLAGSDSKRSSTMKRIALSAALMVAVSASAFAQTTEFYVVQDAQTVHDRR